MTLWNLIRNFFVEHVFGGFTVVNGTVRPISGNMVYYDNGIIDSRSYFLSNGISLGDWLSTTFTIITLVLLVMFLYIFVKWIFKLFSGLLH